MPEWIACVELVMWSISTGRSPRHSIEVCSLCNTDEEINAKHLFEETDWLRARRQQGSRPGRVIERLNVWRVDVSSLVPARLHDDIRSSLTTSSAPTSPVSSATSSSDTSCSAATYCCSCHLYIRARRAVVLLLVDGWPRLLVDYWLVLILVDYWLVLILVDYWLVLILVDYWLILLLVGYRLIVILVDYWLILTRRTALSWRKRRITGTLKRLTIID